MSKIEIERTFVMIKPDGVKRGLIGEIIKRIEQKGQSIIEMKMFTPTVEFIRKHYAVHSEKDWFESNCQFVSSGRVVAMIVEGPGAIDLIRNINGATKPLESAPGTIRGDFGFDGQQTIVHGSDSKENAAEEIALWFPELIAA